LRWRARKERSETDEVDLDEASVFTSTCCTDTRHSLPTAWPTARGGGVCGLNDAPRAPWRAPTRKGRVDRHVPVRGVESTADTCALLSVIAL
jgi:hypothetical protein